MIKRYSFEIFKPNWPKWKINVADAVLNILPLGVASANKLLSKFSHLKNHVFINEVIKEQGHLLEVNGIENLPSSGPLTLIANHPGGADVIATISAISRKRTDFVILANELICVEPVVDIVLPVNTLAKNNKLNMDAVHQAYRDGKVVVFYAAGKNSRYNDKGELRDRKWRPTFLDFALQYNTPISVLKIEGSNAPLFYKVSKFRERSKSFKKVPLENMLQLRELTNAKKEAIKLEFSETIEASSIKESLGSKELKDKRVFADKLYKFLYDMTPTNTKFKG